MALPTKLRILKTHVQLHITEGACRIIFHVEDVHFELNTNLYLDGLADYVVKNALKIANDFHTPDVEPKKASVLELKKTPVEAMKIEEVKIWSFLVIDDEEDEEEQHKEESIMHAAIIPHFGGVID
uniref:Uncharacterized protein n=1 Tax=Acrobeloides nanus TaxID=290746 RepID=A0A914C960_9BILA